MVNGFFACNIFRNNLKTRKIIRFERLVLSLFVNYIAMSFLTHNIATFASFFTNTLMMPF
jgi:hypothetical protein